MHCNKPEEACSIALKIGKEIAKYNSSRLKHLGKDTSSADLWDAVRQVITQSKQNSTSPPTSITAIELNDHYSSISTDNCYSEPLKKSTVMISNNPISEMQVFYILDSLHHTAEGLDGLPAWFIRVAAPFFSKAIAHLFNLSISQSHVPSQWKTAIIHPIAKVNKPTLPSDFRPISVVPIISRTLEKLVVRSHLYPILENPSCCHMFKDQHAFRPTGSTTAAIISILHTITNILKDYPHAILISLDFSKPFDTVRHSCS